MNREKKAWIGILALVGLLAPVSNSANALENTTENNLLSKSVKSEPADPKSAFLVLQPKSKVVLAKYENAHNLGDGQLVELLKAVGFKGKALRSACAIAKAESNGRPLAFNGNHKTGDSSYGMFQINMIGELGPDRREKFDLNSNAELFNPVTNAKVALHMTKSGTDWSSWSSLNGKRYHEWYNKYPCKV
jgi:hypothetical protein